MCAVHTGLLQHLASVLHGDMLAAEYTLLALAAKALRVAGRQPTHQVHTVMQLAAVCL
jgi:hypothetical protein